MKKLKLTKVIASTLVVASILALNPIGASASWKQDSNGWWNTEGNSWSIGWKQIDGKWYYFNSDGYMAHDTLVDGYYVGKDGTIPQYVGFDKIPLSKESVRTYNSIGGSLFGTEELNGYYNTGNWETNKINSLSIAKTNYLKDYTAGNILVSTQPSGKGQDDFIIDLNKNYSRLTAIAGIDDLSNYNGTIKLEIIADGYLLDAKELILGQDAVNIDINLKGYKKLIIRATVESNNSNWLYDRINYDILGAKLYY